MGVKRLKQLLFFCGIDKNKYLAIRSLIWQRNRNTLRITSLLSAAMGLLFLFLNLLLRSGVWIPYLFLSCGSVIIYVLLRILPGSKKYIDSQLLCYGQMILLCAYSSILSVQQGNYAIPATSVIVFISLLPMSIDDRPIRMYAVMLLESLFYLAVSYAYKSPHAFSLDLMNVLSFCVIGMTLYAVICSRTVSEIYQSHRVEKIQRDIISSLATLVEERDQDTGGHVQRTEDYVAELTELMQSQERYAGLTKEYFKNITLAAPMHDIGKIKIPDGILNKPGRLTAEEFEIMKKHAEYGAEILQKTVNGLEDDDYCTIASNIAKYHHERYDGRGYPEGLQGEDIPLEARIMALADVYDALISERVYKKAFSKEQAVEIIREGSGTQFDPQLVPLFLICVE